jgi:hypothetical protein
MERQPKKKKKKKKKKKSLRVKIVALRGLPVKFQYFEMEVCRQVRRL